LRNLASWQTGLREMQRVAAPGARLLILDFGKPDYRLWRAIYFGYLRFVVPVWGRIFAGNAAAYAYILASLQHYPAQRGVADQMRASGLTETTIVNLLGGIMSINYGKKPMSPSVADPN
jgi:demethylmenaquinone methyltransferase/2-methoxy-6-polyprenyl-1,4-benzoquinol methylase